MPGDLFQSPVIGWLPNSFVGDVEAAAVIENLLMSWLEDEDALGEKI